MGNNFRLCLFFYILWIDDFLESVLYVLNYNVYFLLKNLCFKNSNILDVITEWWKKIRCWLVNKVLYHSQLAEMLDCQDTLYVRNPAEGVGMGGTVLVFDMYVIIW